MVMNLDGRLQIAKWRMARVSAVLIISEREVRDGARGEFE
jgi:hypothetical protein